MTLANDEQVAILKQGKEEHDPIESDRAEGAKDGS